MDQNINYCRQIYPKLKENNDMSEKVLSYLITKYSFKIMLLGSLLDNLFQLAFNSDKKERYTVLYQGFGCHQQ